MLPPELRLPDTTETHPTLDYRRMRLSHLDYKIVILFFLPLPPQKLTSLTTGKLSQFSLTP
jgi:hypothetical protein